MGQNQQHSVQNASNQQGNQFQGQRSAQPIQGSQWRNQPPAGQYQAGQSQQFQQQNGAQNNVQNSGFAQVKVQSEPVEPENQQYSESNTSDDGVHCGGSIQAQRSPYANGQTPFQTSPRSRSARSFATPAGWSVIAGAVALLIIIILVLIFTLPRISNAAASEAPRVIIGSSARQRARQAHRPPS